MEVPSDYGQRDAYGTTPGRLRRKFQALIHYLVPGLPLVYLGEQSSATTMMSTQVLVCPFSMAF